MLPRLEGIRARVAMLAAACCISAAASLSATELGATHLVFEKPTGMKKVSVTLFMSFLDPSEKGDAADAARRLRCTATTLGKKGSVPPGGRFVVRLIGNDAGAPWQSRELVRSLDERGSALFDSDAIAGLVSEAGAANPELFQIGLDGGRGRKVARVTIDCIHERAEAQ